MCAKSRGLGVCYNNLLTHIVLAAPAASHLETRVLGLLRKMQSVPKQPNIRTALMKTSRPPAPMKAAMARQGAAAAPAPAGRPPPLPSKRKPAATAAAAAARDNGEGPSAADPGVSASKRQRFDAGPSEAPTRPHKAGAGSAAGSKTHSVAKVVLSHADCQALLVDCAGAVKKLRALQKGGDDMPKEQVAERTRKYLLAIGQHIEKLVGEKGAKVRGPLWAFVSDFTNNPVEGSKLEAIYLKIKARAAATGDGLASTATAAAGPQGSKASKDVSTAPSSSHPASTAPGTGSSNARGDNHASAGPAGPRHGPGHGSNRHAGNAPSAGNRHSHTHQLSKGSKGSEGYGHDGRDARDTREVSHAHASSSRHDGDGYGGPAHKRHKPGTGPGPGSHQDSRGNDRLGGHSSQRGGAAGTHHSSSGHRSESHSHGHMSSHHKAGGMHDGNTPGSSARGNGPASLPAGVRR